MNFSFFDKLHAGIPHSLKPYTHSSCMSVGITLVLSALVSLVSYGAVGVAHDVSDNSIMLRYRLSPDFVDALNLQGHRQDFHDGLNTYIRISILSLLFLSIVVLGFLVVYGVSRWMSPSLFASKAKLRYMLFVSSKGVYRGRNRTCILENGSSGGTMNKCECGTCVGA